MRRSEILCYRCVYPYALDYCRTRIPPPSYIRGAVANRSIRCTRCGEDIPSGRGHVTIRGDDRAECQDPAPAKLSGNAGSRIRR